MSKSASHTKQDTRKAACPNAHIAERQNSLGAHVCIQRETNGLGVQPTAPLLVRDVLNSPGQPLNQETRSFMEPRFGYDFSGVRVHTDEKAAESAQAVRANAYTAGQHVAFANGRYAPDSINGRQLIAHELTHVVQQSSGEVEGRSVGGGLHINDPNDRFEQEARVGKANLDDAMFSSSRSHGPSRSVSSPKPSRRTLVQRSDADSPVGTTFGAIGGVGSLLGGVAGIFSAVYAHEQAEQAKRQAVAGEKQAKEAEKGNVIATENLDVAKQALAVAENPPAPAPTTGGIVVNNNSGYNDVPAVSAPKTSAAKSGDEKEASLTILKVSQGTTNFAAFNASVKTNGKDIKGGYLQDGEAQGYLGGSVASNLNLTLKPVAGPPAPYVTPKGTPTTVASVRFLISGNNIAPRSKSGTPIQHFSGAVTVSAAGSITLSQPFSVNPGSPVAGNGTTAPAVVIDLPISAPTPTGPAPPTPTPTPGKAGGGAPPTEGSGSGSSGAGGGKK